MTSSSINIAQIALCVMTITWLYSTSGAQVQGVCLPVVENGPAFIRNGTCVPHCDSDDYYEYVNASRIVTLYECKKCNESCSGCFYGTSKSCLQCRSEYFRQRDKECGTECNVSDCVRSCDHGYHTDTDSRECKPCFDVNCLTCDGPEEGKCKDCNETYFMENGKCVVNCTTDDYERDEKFMICRKHGIDGKLVGIIVGAILGCLVLGALVAFAVYYIYKHKPFRREETNKSTIPSVQDLINPEYTNARYASTPRGQDNLALGPSTAPATKEKPPPKPKSQAPTKKTENGPPEPPAKPPKPDDKHKMKLPLSPTSPNQPKYSNIGGGTKSAASSRGPIYGNQLSEDGQRLPLYGNTARDDGDENDQIEYEEESPDGWPQEEYMNNDFKTRNPDFEPNKSHLYLPLQKVKGGDGIRPY